MDLPYEMTLNVCKFLAMPDIRALSLTSSGLSRVRSDESLFQKLYQRDFAYLVRPTTEAEMATIVANTKPKYQMHMQKRLQETNITQEEAKRLLNFSQTPSWSSEGRTWKALYTVLYNTRRTMLSHMRTKLALQKHPLQLHGGQCFMSYTRDLPDESIEVAFSTFISRLPLAHSLKFTPDYYFVLPQVKAKHLDLAHQIFCINNELGRRDEDDPDRASQIPQSGTFCCVSEGLVWWNIESQKYELVYPISSLRPIFYQCKEQALQESRVKSEIIKAVLGQKVVITYEIHNSDLFHQGVDHVLSEIQCWLDDCEVTTEDFTLEGQHLSLTCSRAPKWKYKDGQCVSSSASLTMT